MQDESRLKNQDPSALTVMGIPTGDFVQVEPDPVSQFHRPRPRLD
jgi:hypothetical protein